MTNNLLPGIPISIGLPGSRKNLLPAILFLTHAIEYGKLKCVERIARDKKLRQCWNWQTGTFEGRVRERTGSSPVCRTKKKRTPLDGCS